MAAVFDEASEPSAASGSSAPSAADPETEGESAASVPVSVESAVAVTTEESVQLLVSDPDLTPAETNTGMLDIDLSACFSVYIVCLNMDAATGGLLYFLSVQIQCQQRQPLKKYVHLLKARSPQTCNKQHRTPWTPAQRGPQQASNQRR